MPPTLLPNARRSERPRLGPQITEPTGNLDSKTGVEIMALFDRLRQQGNTIVLVTHEPDIADYAHRVIHVRDGKVEKDEAKP